MAGVSFEVVASMDRAMATIKSGTQKISGWVTGLGKNKVPWDEILTGALDPAAVIGEIMTLFGTAVLSVGSFQASLQSASTEGSNAFSSNMGQMGQAAIDMSSATGASLSNSADAMANASAMWSDPSMANAVATFSDTLSTMGGQFGNAGDDARLMSRVLKTFGITDVPTANQAMYDLYTAAKNSGMSFSDFANTIVSTGPSLKANNIDLQGAVDTLSSLATQSGMTAETAKAAFSSFAADIEPGNVAGKALLKTLSPGIANALKDGNITTAMADLERGFVNGGQKAAIIAQQAGWNGEAIAAMTVAGKSHLEDLGRGVSTLTDLQGKFSGKFEASLDDVGKLEVAWNKFQAQFLTTIGPLGDATIKFFTTMLDNGTSVMNEMTTDWKGAIMDVTGSIIPALQPIFDNIKSQSQSALAEAQNETTLTTILSNKALQGSLGGIGNIGGLMGAVGSSSDKNLVTELINALKTGSTTNMSNISNQLNIGTINTQNQSPQQIESALYAALYKKFQNG